ncbi:MAG: hypothetical protein WDA18_00495 [Candidatus Ratteibacteria bacterium]|jgi:uncharacterized membrane protein (UPF0127 family)
MRYLAKNLLLSKILLIGLFLSSLAVFSSSAETKPYPVIPFSLWPQKTIKGFRILVADSPKLSFQGFGGAAKKEFHKTLMIFPAISEGTTFENINHGFGTVIEDLDIAFLDQQGRVLCIDRMKKIRGTATAPSQTVWAVEFSPKTTKQLKPKRGELFPYFAEIVLFFLSLQ